MFNQIENEQKQIQKQKADLIKKEFETYRLQQGHTDSTDSEQFLEDKKEFLQLENNRCRSSFDQERIESLLTWLEIDLPAGLSQEQTCQIISEEITKIQNRNVKCDNQIDFVTSREIKTFNDLFQIWFPNKDQGTCYSKAQLISFMSDTDNIRADWVQNSLASILLERPENVDGEGGLPGNRRYRQIPYQFKLYIPEPDYQFLINTFNSETDYQLVPYENIRVGNVRGVRGVSDSHGQDQYPIYQLFSKTKTIKDGRYLQGRTLGKGSFGSALIVYDTQDRKVKAIKQIQKTSEATSSGDQPKETRAYQTGLNEIEIMKKLQRDQKCDQHLVCYQTHFEEDNHLYIVMDYIDGCNLLDLAPDPEDHPYKWVKFIRELSQAVEYLHQQGIAHKDIHPPNVVYDRRQQRFKLIDFGLSCTSATCPQKQRINKNFAGPGLPDDLSNLEFDFWKKVDYFSLGLTFLQQLVGSDDFYRSLREIYSENSGNPNDFYKKVYAYLGKSGDFRGGIYDANPAIWAKGIILGLINPDPEKRLNTTQVIDWLNSIEGSLTAGTTIKYPKVFENIKERILCRVDSITTRNPLARDQGPRLALSSNPLRPAGRVRIRRYGVTVDSEDDQPNLVPHGAPSLFGAPSMERSATPPVGSPVRPLPTWRPPPSQGSYLSDDEFVPWN
jgi:serine/threonine protein kinase